MASTAQLRRKARRIAKRHGIDPDIFVRQIQQESGFNPRARSGAGALGIAQFIPSTARAYGVDPFNVDSALNGAARYLKANLKKYGSYRKALSVYNSGSPTGYKSIAETRNYVRTILGSKNPAYSPGSTSTSPATVTASGATLEAPAPSAIRGLERAPMELPELKQAQQPAPVQIATPTFGRGLPDPRPATAQVELPSYTSALLPSIRERAAQVQSGGGLPAEEQQAPLEVPGISATVLGSRGSSKGGRVKVRGKGGFGGTQGIAKELAGLTGLASISEKRARKFTASGNVSDHWQELKDTYAIDLGSRRGDPKALERGARRIAKALGIRNYRPNRIYNVYRNGYRIQLIYGAAVAHGDHVHVGVKKAR